MLVTNNPHFNSKKFIRTHLIEELVQSKRKQMNRNYCSDFFVRPVRDISINLLRGCNNRARVSPLECVGEDRS